ncbi:Globulin-1 S allele, partial [Ophiophagus hannah]
MEAVWKDGLMLDRITCLAVLGQKREEMLRVPGFYTLSDFELPGAQEVQRKKEREKEERGREKEGKGEREKERGRKREKKKERKRRGRGKERG